MSADQNKALVTRAITELNNRGNTAVIDDLFAESFTSTPLWPNPTRPASMGTPAGREVPKAGVTMMRAALPDLTVTIDTIVAEGDTVMVCTTTRGTHTGGPFFDLPASGKALQWTTFAIYRIADGKIVEERWLWDRLGAFQQLGIAPSQAELRQRMQTPAS